MEASSTVTVAAVLETAGVFAPGVLLAFAVSVALGLTGWAVALFQGRGRY